MRTEFDRVEITQKIAKANVAVLVVARKCSYQYSIPAVKKR